MIFCFIVMLLIYIGGTIIAFRLTRNWLYKFIWPVFIPFCLYKMITQWD